MRIRFAALAILLASCGGDSAGPPSLSDVAPASGPVGTTITLTGDAFGGSGAILVGGAIPAAVTSWADTSITATVPSLPAGAHSVTVSHGGGASEPRTFTVTP